MSVIYVKKIELSSIHKRYGLNISFNKTLNVLHGQNGTGKSTLLHIIANIANCDFWRFAFIEFSSIKVLYSNGLSITLLQTETEYGKEIKIQTDSGSDFSFSKKDAYEIVNLTEEDRNLRDFMHPLLSKMQEFIKENNLRVIETSYFPAFRTMLEAWSSQRETEGSRFSRRPIAIRKSTAFSRNLFGQFLPVINFPSPIDIEESLRDEIRDAQIRIARYESSIFSDSFVKVFSALLSGASTNVDTDELLREISQLTDSSNNSKLGDFEENSNTYRQLQDLVSKSSESNALASSAAGALAVYRDALKERQKFQKHAFSEIDSYFGVVNSFLERKELAYQLDKQRRIPKVGLKFPDESWSSIKVMSSGERQLLTMLYAVNKMSGNATVLIDEPELSLHIDWQEELLGKMMEQLGDRQIIVCTHSPSIAADFEKYMKEIVPIFDDKSNTASIDINEDEGYL